jgi:cysteine desulfuration protein SufE
VNIALVARVPDCNRQSMCNGNVNHFVSNLAMIQLDKPQDDARICRLPTELHQPRSHPTFCRFMKLFQLFEELRELEPDEKLEWLVEFADELPELSKNRCGQPFPETCRVQECQTPVHLWTEVVGGRLHLEADVPRQSPVVRGLVALLVIGLEGAPISTALDLPDDLAIELGLNTALGMTRQQGFRGVVARIKQDLSRVQAID